MSSCRGNTLWKARKATSVQRRLYSQKVSHGSQRSVIWKKRTLKSRVIMQEEVCGRREIKAIETPASYAETGSKFTKCYNVSVHAIVNPILTVHLKWPYFIL